MSSEMKARFQAMEASLLGAEIACVRVCSLGGGFRMA